MLEETATAPLPPEQLKAGGKKPAGGPPLGNSNNTKHALRLLKEKVRKLGTRAIDGRSKLALMLRDLREAIMSDLGGKDQLSQAQMILVDDVARLTFWIDSIDGWLLTLPSVINKKKRTLLPVVKERKASYNFSDVSRRDRRVVTTTGACLRPTNRVDSPT